MRKTKLAVVIIVAVSLSGCNWWSSKKSDDSEPSEFDGIWLAEAYGHGLKLDNGNLESFDFTSDYCLLEDKLTVSSSELAEVALLNDNATELELISGVGTEQFHAPGVIYTKAVTLPYSCTLGYVDVVGESGYSRDPERDAEIFFQTFDELYIDLSLTDVDWGAVRQQVMAEIDSDTTDAELLDLFYNAITPLKDAHVSIDAELLGTASVNNEPVFFELMLNRFIEQNNLTLPLTAENATAFNYFLGEAYNSHYNTIMSYAESDESVNMAFDGAVKWFTNQGIGYLELTRMYDYGNGDDAVEEDLEALAEAMPMILEDLADTDALIFDLRMNNGGRDVNSMKVASYFIEQSGVLASKAIKAANGTEITRDFYVEAATTTYTKPIFLLTSASTVSAAESLTLMLRSQSHVIMIGENTQGALSDMLEKQLPNGFQFSLSNEKYLSTDGEWFERQGIPVDIEVELFKEQDWQEEVDPAIEAVLAILEN